MELIHVKASRSACSPTWEDTTLNPRHIIRLVLKPEIEVIRVYTVDGDSVYVSINDLDKVELGMEHQNDMTVTEVIVTQSGQD